MAWYSCIHMLRPRVVAYSNMVHPADAHLQVYSTPLHDKKWLHINCMLASTSLLTRFIGSQVYEQLSSLLLPSQTQHLVHDTSAVALAPPTAKRVCKRQTRRGPEEDRRIVSTMACTAEEPVGHTRACWPTATQSQSTPCLQHAACCKFITTP